MAKNAAEFWEKWRWGFFMLFRKGPLSPSAASSTSPNVLSGLLEFP
jgi:hypothetical protein